MSPFLLIPWNIHDYENGQRQLPVDVLVKLAAYYQTSTDYLLGLTDERTPYPPSRRTAYPAT